MRYPYTFRLWPGLGGCVSVEGSVVVASTGVVVADDGTVSAGLAAGGGTVSANLLQACVVVIAVVVERVAIPGVAGGRALSALAQGPARRAAFVVVQGPGIPAPFVFADATGVAVPLGFEVFAVGVATAAAVALGLVEHTAVVVAFVAAVPEPLTTASAAGTGFPPEHVVDLVAASRCRIVPVPGAVGVASGAAFDVFLPGVVFANASGVAVALGLATLAVGVALALVGHPAVVVAFVTAVPEALATASAVGTGFPPELAVSLGGAVVVPSATAFGFVPAAFEYVAVPDVVFANGTSVAVPLGLAALVVGVAATASVAVAVVGHTAVAVAFVTAAPGEWTVAGVVGSGSDRESVPAPVSIPNVEAPRSAGQLGVPGGGHPKGARDEVLSVRSRAGHLAVPNVEAPRSAGQVGTTALGGR
ncbi:hypothetical protein CBR_g23986 [Chara braunii]|uniref:Uncharacterized protein n=1 Tax=Chara braunii TaxID=69332 RepID=A0A388L5F9_CHABU|nr:hypothetical protein CBR_g23986 [Chara braunii]|eukprot:GBG77541.1 hypothetical protein CBR_g23986 [Chara braunii]